MNINSAVESSSNKRNNGKIVKGKPNKQTQMRQWIKKKTRNNCERSWIDLLKWLFRRNTKETQLKICKLKCTTFIDYNYISSDDRRNRNNKPIEIYTINIFGFIARSARFFALNFFLRCTRKRQCSCWNSFIKFFSFTSFCSGYWYN